MRIAVTSTAAFRHQHPFARFREIMHYLAGFFVVDDGSNRHGDLEVVAVAAMPIAAFSVTAAAGTKHVVEPKFQKRVFVGVRFEVDAAAIAAVTAARAASRDVLLPAECNASVTSVAGFDCDLGFVDEHW